MQGTLIRGKGEAAGFTAIPWVRQQAIDRLGIDPHPGTVNIRLNDPASLAVWMSVRSSQAVMIDPPSAEGGRFCRARCYPMRIGGMPAAAVVPEVEGYPHDTVELIAAVGVRDALSLVDGDTVALEIVVPLAVRAVLFDVDGTMLDSLPAFHEVARLAAEPHGYSVRMEHIRAALAGNNSFWGSVVPEDLPDRQILIRSMAQHAGREWSRVLREHGRLHDGLAEMLLRLKQRGFELGIVTGARSEVIEMLREHGIAQHFSVIITANDVKARKPDPEGILLCLDRMGVSAGEAVYVGDAPIDVEASHGAGLPCIGVLTGAGDSAMLTRSRAHRLIATVAEVPRLVERI